MRYIVIHAVINAAITAINDVVVRYCDPQHSHILACYKYCNIRIDTVATMRIEQLLLVGFLVFSFLLFLYFVNTSERDIKKGE